MYTISAQYAAYLDGRSRTWLVKVNIAGTDYVSSEIVDFVLENSIAPLDEFLLGTAIPSKLTLRLKTSASIPANAKVIPYLAMTGDDGETEWLSVGEFYIDDREEINNVWEFTCYNALVTADVPYISSLAYPATMQAVWDEIMTSLGFTSDASVVINPAYTIPVGPAGYTKRQVMGFIAGCNAACIYMGNDGKVKFRKFAASDAKVFAMTDSKYIRAKQMNPKKTYTRIVATYDEDGNNSYSAGTGDDDHTLEMVNPFATQSIVNDLLTALNGFSYTPVAIDARGYPQLEPGDRIRYGVYVGTPAWQDADTPWNATAYSWDGYTSGGMTIALHTVYSFHGGLKMSIEAPSKSAQRSEFNVDGSLTKAVADIRNKAVRTDKTYYGATLNADDGFIVERSDHKSKVTFNSDDLMWEVSGSKKLWYDAINDRLTISGAVIMGPGSSISWGDVTPPAYADITGTKPPTNADNTESKILGHGFTKIGSNYIYTETIEADQLNVNTLSAIVADLGSITAGDITGVTITGATIQTASGTEKIVLDDDGFHSYDSAGNQVINISPHTTTYGLAGIEFGTDDTHPMGWLFSNSSIFGIWGNNNASLRSIFGELVLDGTIKFASTSKVNFTGVDLTMPQKADAFFGATYGTMQLQNRAGTMYYDLTFANGVLVGLSAGPL